ncbi:PilX N-terminal [Malonomonas rubra DSM 5091]|uniref:PilX N-terminal n=1 Tax=Malonomonas rubra DSM 5091 TaxID=1122189 RepID=A0A1M6IKR0_MALRU|nr:PilX N-terminal domain-containing pilus assembly protein [Malonomonas rubra]SHJ34999.1 PilX N-terminal [Malonomonas rubra DSM 5091]
MLIKQIPQKAPHHLTPLVQNQRGSILIIAMLLLAIMSVLGTVLMSTSTTEIQISGNYRNKQESFYVADRALEYSMRSASDFSGTVDLYNDQNTSLATPTLHRNLIELGNGGLEASTITTTDDRNSVTFINAGPPPVGSGSDASLFEARNYVGNAVGLFPINTNNPSRTELRSQFAKIVPK